MSQKQLDNKRRVDSSCEVCESRLNKLRKHRLAEERAGAQNEELSKAQAASRDLEVECQKLKDAAEEAEEAQSARVEAEEAARAAEARAERMVHEASQELEVARAAQAKAQEEVKKAGEAQGAAISAQREAEEMARAAQAKVVESEIADMGMNHMGGGAPRTTALVRIGQHALSRFSCCCCCCCCSSSSRFWIVALVQQRPSRITQQAGRAPPILLLFHPLQRPSACSHLAKLALAALQRVRQRVLPHGCLAQLLLPMAGPRLCRAHLGLKRHVPRLQRGLLAGIRVLSLVKATGAHAGSGWRALRMGSSGGRCPPRGRGGGPALPPHIELLHL